MSDRGESPAPLVVKVFVRRSRKQRVFSLEAEAINPSARAVVLARLRAAQQLILGASSADPDLLVDTEWQEALANTTKLVNRYK